MLITLGEYERIYKVINTLVINESGDPAYACILFSAFGSYILEKHHKIKTHFKAGLAAYHVGADNDAIVFGEFNSDGELTGREGAFHCWLETDEWAIDFMAPSFPELYKKFGKPLSIPSYMFQKPLSKMATSIEELKTSGDFYLESDPASVLDKMSVVASRQAYADLAEICVQWYQRPPKKMQKSIKILDQNGKDMSTSLKGNTVVGAW